VGQADKDVDLGLLKIEEDQLDGALSEDPDAVIRLFTADFQGYSDSSYLTFYQASDLLSTPGTYDVEVDFDAGGNITAARIKLSSESTFRDATMNSSYIVGTADNPESGLWIKAVWDGSSSTQTATVRVTQGIAGATARTLDDVLDSAEGILHNIDKSYGDIVGQLQDRIDREEERLQRLQERLVLKYARLEQLLIEIQGQFSWNSATASAISGSATS
jgi:flagellar hook-associated protein 2